MSSETISKVVMSLSGTFREYGDLDPRYQSLNLQCSANTCIFEVKLFSSWFALSPIIPAPTTATDPAETTILATTFNWLWISRSTRRSGLSVGLPEQRIRKENLRGTRISGSSGDHGRRHCIFSLYNLKSVKLVL